MQRREVLIVGGGVSLGLAGCSGFDSDGNESESNDQDPEANNSPASDDSPTGDDSSDNIADQFDKEIVTQFETTGESGFIAFNESTREDAEAEGTPFPDEIVEQVSIDGVLFEDGTWTSTDTNFPTVSVDETIDATAKFPDGLGGELDRETGRMTMTGTVTAVLTTDADEEYELPFDVSLTTGESGVVTGHPLQNGGVRLVDNQFPVQETDSPVLNTDLELPSTEAGRNWLVVRFRVDFEDRE